jgi:hypothetical protein
LLRGFDCYYYLDDFDDYLYDLDDYCDYYDDYYYILYDDYYYDYCDYYDDYYYYLYDHYYLYNDFKQSDMALIIIISLMIVDVMFISL